MTRGLNIGFGQNPLTLNAAPVQYWLNPVPNTFPGVGTNNPLGMNLAQVAYYSTEQPFINLMKSGGRSTGSGDGLTGWITCGTGAQNDTLEAGYLQLDSNGYPTSLTASPTPSGGQVFTQLFCIVVGGMTSVPGVSTPYPSGTYRLKVTGNCVISVEGDGTASLTITDGGTHSTTFSVTASTSLRLRISSIGGGTGSALYPNSICVNLDSLSAAYDAGAIFNPAFLTALANLSTVRFMDWMNQAQGKYVDMGAISSTGTTSMTLGSNWLYPTGSYPTYFGDGSTKSVTYTLGSTSATWTGALGTVPGGSSTFAEIPPVSWSTRPQPSNCFWSLTAGVPLEICAALCNQLSAHCWMTCPLTANDTYISNQSALMLSGTGAQSGYGGLNSGLNFYSELSNEVWNGAAKPFHVAGYLGGGVWPAQSPGGGNAEWQRNWYGMRCATKATLEQTAWGSSFSRCIPIIGGQAAGTFSVTDALACSYWTSGPASNYPIKGIAIAPYWGFWLNQTDTNNLTAQSDGGLGYFFQLMTSNVVTGGTDPGTYGASSPSGSVLPSGGWLGQVETWIQTYLAIMSSYPGMNLIAYEGGPNFLLGGGAPTGWNTLAIAAQSDTRMGTALTTYLNYWKTNVGGTQSNINCLYTDFQPDATDDSWGILQSVMQTISPLTSAPPKYQAVQNYIA